VKAVERDVVVVNFLSQSRASEQALKSANILRTLKVNALIGGEVGVGKLTLAKHILPNALILRYSAEMDLEYILRENNDLIIHNIEDFINISLFDTLLHKHNTRIIATSSKTFPKSVMDQYFSLHIFLPNLASRKEDIPLLAHVFLEEINTLLNQNIVLDMDAISFDVSQNAHSLKKSVFFEVLTHSPSEKEVMKVMHNFLDKRLGGTNDYRDFSYLFDVPIISLGLKKLGSQLQVSAML